MMMRNAWRMTLAIGVIMWSELLYADELSVVGTWKLTAYLREEVSTGENTRPWGERPTGYLTYLPDGHMIVLISAEARQLVPANDEKFVEKTSQLLFNMAAYAGTYEIQDKKVIHHVEVAWLPSWVGTDQPREFNLVGDSLSIRTQPIRHARDGKEYIYVLDWKRVSP